MWRCTNTSLSKLNRTYQELSQGCWPETVHWHQGSCEPHKSRLQSLMFACCLLLWMRCWWCWEKREAGAWPYKMTESPPFLIDSNKPESKWQQIRRSDTVNCLFYKSFISLQNGYFPFNFRSWPIPYSHRAPFENEKSNPWCSRENNKHLCRFIYRFRGQLFGPVVWFLFCYIQCIIT